MSSPAPTIGSAVRAVLRHALDTYRDDEVAVSRLRRQLDRMDEPLRVAIAGKVKAGKSTLLNALVGEEIAPTDASECTKVITWYRDGVSPRITLTPVEGAARQLPVRRQDGRLLLDLGDTPPDQVERVVIDWPSRSLRANTLIDTPGIASLTTENSARTTVFLTPDDEPSAADAIIYLMRHIHGSDIRFLESFRDQEVGRAAMVNTVAVLSRADEVGVGRMDAMRSAQRVAERYRADPQLSVLCQTVVPVAGLLAETARTMRQVEFAALCDLAREPVESMDSLMLSADRFVRPDAPVAVPAATRAALLERFGFFGIRIATMLVRLGVSDPATLATDLVARSGLNELQEVLAVQFTQRQDLLKARSALLAMTSLLHERPRPDATGLAGEVERIMSGAHEFRELRLIAALRSPGVKLPTEARTEAERLLGAHGTRPQERLGLPQEAEPRELRDAALAALRRWQQRAESPMSDRPTAEAARVVTRSCEGMLAWLPQTQRAEL